MAAIAQRCGSNDPGESDPERARHSARVVPDDRYALHERRRMGCRIPYWCVQSAAPASMAAAFL